MKKKAALVLIAAIFLLAGNAWGRSAGFGETVEAEIEKPAPSIRIVGTIEVDQIRSGEVIDSWETHNICTTEGLGAVMGCMFGGWSQKGTWYVLLSDTDFTPSISDTYAGSIEAGVSEFTEYDEANRPEWQGAASGATSWTNSSNRATFTISNGVSGVSTVYGIALVSGVTKEDATSGDTMYNIAKFSASKTVEEDDILRVTLTLTANPE